MAAGRSNVLSTVFIIVVCCLIGSDAFLQICGVPAIPPDVKTPTRIRRSYPAVNPPLLLKNNSTKGEELPHIAPNTIEYHTEIVGGQPAVPHSWPWMADVMIGDVLCGGTLINLSWVLTAAHCVQSSRSNPSEITVKLGVNDRAEKEPDVQSFSAAQVIPHEDFNHPYQFYNDIALIKLDHPAEITDTVSVVCIPKKSDDSMQTGVNGVVTGWGRISEYGPTSPLLLEVIVPVVDQKICATTFGSHQISDTMFCAGNMNDGTDACHGDSGGPLVMLDPNTSCWTQYGIVSFGSGCGTAERPGVYTKVSSFQPWILLNMLMNNSNSTYS